MKYHDPVLKKELIAHLNVQKGKKYIDATLGDGGHTIEILKQGGLVLALDIYEQSLNRAKQRIHNEGFSNECTFTKGNFKDIDSIARSHGYNEVSGIIYDLGYSSFQMDEQDLGLSFQEDGPLDMRMDSTLGVTAADLINSLSEKELTKMIKNLSGEMFAKKIAKRIVEARSLKRLERTKELVDLVSSSVSPGYEKGRIHPATRTFQALRIAVNDELSNLETSLPRAAHLLLPGGRMMIISFHSLEDKIVKNFGQGAQPTLKAVIKKPITPAQDEIKNNIRARSAKMRVFEKAK
jgi:16S rRNA (cytosine1402-N4)-methyltransferase